MICISILNVKQTKKSKSKLKSCWEQLHVCLFFKKKLLNKIWKNWWWFCMRWFLTSVCLTLWFTVNSASWQDLISDHEVKVLYCKNACLYHVHIKIVYFHCLLPLQIVLFWSYKVLYLYDKTCPYKPQTICMTWYLLVSKNIRIDLFAI